MSMQHSLRNNFLIAMPRLDDPNFTQSVTLVCEHTSEGALGLVINFPTDLMLHELFEHMGIAKDENCSFNPPVLSGGPMQQERGFVLHTDCGHWQATLAVNEQLFVTSSRDILHAIALNQGPKNALIILGYASWDAGQLDQEIADNVWLTSPLNTDIIFNVPYTDRWRHAAQTVGVDLNRLSSDVGHC